MGWILIRVGTTLVLVRGSTLKKLQLDGSEIVGGSGKVPATCSVCSVCDGSKGRGFGQMWSSVELENCASGLKLCGEGIGTKSKFWGSVLLRSC